MEMFFVQLQETNISWSGLDTSWPDGLNLLIMLVTTNRTGGRPFYHSSPLLCFSPPASPLLCTVCTAQEVLQARAPASNRHILAAGRQQYA